MKKHKGTLYGIGVGPGDPDLISIKALKVLNKVSVVFAPFSTKNSYSIAKRIIKHHTKKDIQIHKLEFPMTKDPEKLQNFWLQNSYTILDFLNQGKDVAFVTLGDPLTYSTFGYILLTLQKIDPEVEIEVIPGISSYQASAAFVKVPLAKGEESFCVISGTANIEKIKSLIKNSDSCVILKPYKNYKKIVETLKELNLLDKAYLVLECGLENERVIQKLEEVDSIPYLSLIIISKK